MNPVRVFLLLLLHLPAILFAQISLEDYSQSFPDGALDKPQTVALVLAIRKTNNSFWTIRKESPNFAAFAKDSALQEVRPQDILARTTFDTSQAHIFLHGVTPKNIANYEFRVIEYPSRQIRVPWMPVTQLTNSDFTKRSGWAQMGYLGGYKAPLGSMLVVDLRKRGNSTIIGTCLVAWEAIRPAVASIYTSADVDIFLQKLQYPWAKTRPLPSYSTNDLRLPATNTNLIYAFNADVLEKKQLQYQLIRNGQIIRPWQDNDYDNPFIWLRDLTPGQYRIQVRYAVQPQHVSEYSFEVEPAWHQSLWFKIALIGVGVVLVGLIVFAYLLIQQRRKTRQQEAQKQKLQLELKALYAQLNPHFVFNALSSIQGLINRQDIKGANDYLSDFARLMRESLANSGQAETSLHQELQTMKTYLKLEQLRFGFDYVIQLDDRLDVYATSLPSLLWQPLLENAVKHGVAPLQQAGRIVVQFEGVNDSLQIRITDNGPGRSVGTVANIEPVQGFGLKLTRERISILNKLNSDQIITLAFADRLVAGTEVILTFNHWLV